MFIKASYSIQTLTGAATAGLAPQISLNYSSGSGNGILGVGWPLSGTTVITRCREAEESRDGSTSYYGDTTDSATSVTGSLY